MFERRNQVRRATCGGVIVGAIAAALLALLEAVVVSRRAGDALAVAGGAGRFTLTVLALAVAAGAVVGFVQGAIVVAVRPAAEALARKRVRTAHWAAVLYTAILTPAIAFLCAAGFSGRRARTLPAHDLLVVGAGIVLILLTFLAFRMLLGAAERIDLLAKRGEGQVRWAVAATAALLAIAVGVYLMDHRILVRRYRFFHVTLELLAFAGLELAVLAASMAARAGERRWGRVAAPRSALAVALVAVSAGAVALDRVRRPEAETLRAVAHEYGAVAAGLLDLARGVGLLPQSGVADGPAAAAPATPAEPAHAVLAADAPRRPGADVFLITVDALRADHVGAYGYARPTTPALDALAAEGAVFERAYCPVPHTSFSVVSLITGKYVLSLARLGLVDGHETLSEALERYGYKTAAFFPPAVFYVDGERFRAYEERRFGFDYVRYEPFPEARDATARTDQVIAYLEAERPAQVFAWVHYFGPHEPYVPHPELPEAAFGDAALDRYDGEIRWVDAEIGRLVAYLRTKRPNAIIAVTSDHGEEFGEHGGAYHGTTLYDEQVRVPLIVYVPGEPPRRVAGPVATVDVMPTLLALLDVPISARVRGTDLTPWLGTRRPAPLSELPPVYAELDAQKMVVWGREKLICDTERGFCRLFDLEADPGERRDVSRERPQRAAELRARLGGWMSSMTEYERADGVRVRDPAGVARRGALERGALGDRDAVGEVAKILVDAAAPAADRAAAARILARLRDPAARPALEAARASDVDPTVRDWATVALAALGEPAALAAARAIPEERLAADPELRARAALAAAAAAGGARDRALVPALVAALDATADLVLQRGLVLALGRTRDPRARAPLEAAYDVILLRRFAAVALGELGDRAAVPFLVARLADETYVVSRAAVAHSLGQLGDARRSQAALARAFHDDPEAQVVAAAAWALAQLGAGATPAGDHVTLALARPATEVWVVLAPGVAAGVGVTVGEVAVDTAVPADAYRVALPLAAGDAELPVTGPVVRLVPRPL